MVTPFCTTWSHLYLPVKVTPISTIQHGHTYICSQEKISPASINGHDHTHIGSERLKVIGKDEAWVQARHEPF